MKKSITIMILLIWTANDGLAQGQQTIDRLKQELVIARQDTTRVLIMGELCAVYRLSNPDSALFYGQQALTLANQIKFPRGEILALSFESFVMKSIGNLPKSLEMGLKALQVAEENQLQKETAAALNSVGGVYRILRDFPKALTYFRRQLIVAENLPDKTGLAYAELAIGNVLEVINQLDSSSYYLKKSLEHFQMVGRVEPRVFANLGRVEMKSGNTSLALDYYQKSLQISLQNDEPTRTSRTYNDISVLYKRIDQTDSSIYYAKKGLAIAEQISQIEIILKSAILLSDLYEPIDANEALRYYKIATMAKDSLYGSANVQAVQIISAQDQERQKEIEAAKIEFENQLWTNAFLGSTFTLLVIALFLYRNNRQKQKAKLKIESAYDQLKSTQTQLIHSEKMASLGELTAGIAHEIQNPLNFVNNFSDVNSELAEELREEIEKGNTDDAKALANDIIDNEKKIVHHGKRAEEIVKSMLQHSRGSEGEKEPTDINALADEYLRLAYHGFRAKDKSFNADFKTELDENLPKISVVPQDIGRVLLNLINNAFQAVMDVDKPTVTVSTRKKDGKIEISVKDNGPGIPDDIKDKIFQPFFTTKPTGEGTGLGLSLSYDIVTKGHGGKIEVTSMAENGTEFLITLPL